MPAQQELKNIEVVNVKINPENPRLFFREKEMDDLQNSIEKIGLQVPISVYKDDGKYFIIDGQRRWTTFKNLGIDKIPAVIQSKPKELENLLLMFNIHGLREQWDIYTIAMKLEKIIALLTEERGTVPNESELSKEIGMPKGTIRRSKMIIALPVRFKRLLKTELEKPKKNQRFSEDFFKMAL